MRLPVAVVGVAAVLAACQPDKPVASASEGPTATTACDSVQTFPIQGEGHLVGGQKPPVAYNSTPPTSGWHSSSDVPIVVAPPGQPLTEPEQVTVLELGGVVVSHGDLPEAGRASLEELVSGRYAGRAALTEYDKLGGGEVALTSWGVAQRCDAVDLPAVEVFISHYAQR